MGGRALRLAYVVAVLTLPGCGASYVTAEDDGSLGSVCIYQASGPDGGEKSHAGQDESGGILRRVS